MGCASSTEGRIAPTRRRPATRASPASAAFERVAAASEHRSTRRHRCTPTPNDARDKPLVECRKCGGPESCSSRTTARRSVVCGSGCSRVFRPAASASSPTATEHPFGVSVEELGCITTWSSFTAAGRGASEDFVVDEVVHDVPWLALPSFGLAYGDDEDTVDANHARCRLPVPRVA